MARIDVFASAILTVAACGSYGCSCDDDIDGSLGSGDASDDASGSQLDASVDALADTTTSPDSSIADAALDGGPELFSTDFEMELPSSVKPGTGVLTPSEGFAPLGPEGNKFGDTFLRAPTGNLIALCLTDLPQHAFISLAFLFAAIDSLDGEGTFPSGDYFTVKVDDMQIFREAFANATADQVQSYDPPEGVLLARRQDLGFQGPGGYYTDSAYDMGAEPQFQNIPHTGDTLTITFELEGEGVQSLDDESWAIDNVKITLSN